MKRITTRLKNKIYDLLCPLEGHQRTGHEEYVSYPQHKFDICILLHLHKCKIVGQENIAGGIERNDPEKRALHYICAETVPCVVTHD